MGRLNTSDLDHVRIGAHGVARQTLPVCGDRRPGYIHSNSLARHPCRFVEAKTKGITTPCFH